MNANEERQRILPKARRLVVKVGSSLLLGAAGLPRGWIDTLAGEITALMAGGREVILVTSGAVAAGAARLGRPHRQRTIPEKQAAAAVGQIDLMSCYEEHFAKRGTHVAQLLLTHGDLADRQRYRNARHTLTALLEARVVPIINENDTVAVEEMKFGDNDNLSADVAVLAEADLLLILSDVDGLHDADPRDTAGATRIAVLDGSDRSLDRYAASGRGVAEVGTGGMITKLEAAHKAASAGIPTLLADGRSAAMLSRALAPATEGGTLVVPRADRLARRKHWIAYTLRPKGVLYLDEGAVRALRDAKRSLLSPGVRRSEGRYGAGDCVRCLGPDGREIARGLVNYPSSDIEKLCGRRTGDIEGLLGYKVSDEIIHRNDLVIL